MNDFLNEVKRIRTDVSDWLVHFTKGDDIEAAGRIRNILTENRLKGAGSPPVICFSEAPIQEFGKLFSLFKRYPNPRFAPYGVLVKKCWLFSRGGRPVIYQPDSEKRLLPKELQYRHVNFDPISKDFTWQREWRIQTESLQLERENTLFVFPDDEGATNAAEGILFSWEVDFEYEGDGEVSINPYKDHISTGYYITLDDINSMDKDATNDEIIAKLLHQEWGLSIDAMT